MATPRRDGYDFALPTFILERYPFLSVLTCRDLHHAISTLCQYGPPDMDHAADQCESDQ